MIVMGIVLIACYLHCYLGGQDVKGCLTATHTTQWARHSQDSWAMWRRAYNIGALIADVPLLLVRVAMQPRHLVCQKAKDFPVSLHAPVQTK